MSNIQNTKNKLTLTFTIIVFVLVLSFWVVFFSTKYVKSYTGEKYSFARITQWINNDNIKLKSLLEFQEMRRTDPRIRWQRPKEESSLLGRWGINFILVNQKNEILSHNIKVEIGDNFLEETVKLESFSKVKVKNDFLITKIPFQEKYTLVMFQKIKYTLWDYLADLLLFLVLGSLLSGLIYVIWRSFVNKTFIPVEENIEDMKNFVHNAGHELKTPLAVIDSNLQLVDDMKTYDKEMNTENRTELKKLNSLINSLIQLTDIDSLKVTEKILLKDVVEEIVEDYKSKITDKNIDCRIRIKNDVIVSAHKDYLYMFISNLVGNAIKYNVEGWKIRIVYSKGELSIADSWVWINDSDKSKIWDRFYQADSSRWWEGFGIGLSLVKKISEIYKWKVSIKDNVKSGTIVKIKF